MGLDCQWLLQAHQNSVEPGYAPKSWWDCSVHVPSILQCWQHSGAGGKGLWGDCAGCFLSFPHEHQQLEMWDSRLWGTLGFALLLLLLPEWEMEVV